MKNVNTWFLLVTIAAFSAGTVWYAYARYGDGAREFSAIAPHVTERGNDVSESAFRIYKTPQAVPELKFLNHNNREITLEVFKGSVVLLNIWATWCVPCREEMPALDGLQAQLGGPDFEVVALSIDRGSRNLIEEFYQELKLDSLKTYHDPTGGASFTLKVPGIPATILIDREGRGIGYRIGSAEWDSPEIVREIKGYLSRKSEEKKI